VNRTGWSIWNAGDERTNHTTFAEYANYGPGASRVQRANFSQFLDAPVSIHTVLNDTAWVDQKWL
jgi:pectinesterase